MAYPRLWLNRVAINLANSRFRRLRAERRALELEKGRAGHFHVEPDPVTAVAVRRALAALTPR
jgi:DNA-directed RNA polymerase specialized sigma24 family protein